MDIKKATINDLEKILSFVTTQTKTLLSQKVDFQELNNLPGRKQIMDRISNDEEFMAIQKDKLIGVMTLSNQNFSYSGVKWETTDSSPIYVDWLIVDSTLDENEIAKELLLFAKSMAEKKGAKSMRLQEYSTGVRKPSFYSQLGYKPVNEIVLEKLKIICYEKKL
jgi:ribosomal protein S18 acetylase RimI-like enzyme